MDKKILILCDIQQEYQDIIINSFTFEHFVKFLRQNYQNYETIYWFYNDLVFASEMKKYVIDLLEEFIFLYADAEIGKEREEIEDIWNKISLEAKMCGKLFHAFDNYWSKEQILDIILNEENHDEDNDLGRPGFADRLIEICQNKKIDICGGMKDWCLREMLCVLDAYNIKYNELKQFIYND